MKYDIRNKSHIVCHRNLVIKSKSMKEVIESSYNIANLNSMSWKLI